jgi:EAL and modified HD-GYP domain-containing signal transduction protein
MKIKGEFFLSKTPILDKQKKVFAYKLLLRDKEDKPLTSGEFARILANLRFDKLFGRHRLFVPIMPDLLENEVLDYINEKKFIFVLDEDLLDEKDFSKIEELKDLGFSFAVRKVDYEKSPEEVKFFDYFIYPKEFALKNDPYKNRVIIRNIKTLSEMESFVKKGFSYFYGDFIFRDTVVGRTITPTKKAIIQLFNRIKDKYNPQEVEEIIKKNADLSLSLLKYVNSAAFYIPTRINSIRKAIMILGQRNLLHWILLYLYTGVDEEDGFYSETLLELAAERGKIMEILAEKIGLSQEEADKAFLVGVFSFVDKLLNMSKEEVKEEFNVDEETYRALTKYEGTLGKLLHLVENIEQAEIFELSKELEETGLSIPDIIQAQMQAYAWFEGIELK